MGTAGSVPSHSPVPEPYCAVWLRQKRESGMLYLARLSTIAGATVVVTAAFIIAAVRVLLS